MRRQAVWPGPAPGRGARGEPNRGVLGWPRRGLRRGGGVGTRGAPGTVARTSADSAHSPRTGVNSGRARRRGAPVRWGSVKRPGTVGLRCWRARRPGRCPGWPVASGSQDPGRRDRQWAGRVGRGDGLAGTGLSAAAGRPRRPLARRPALRTLRILPISYMVLAVHGAPESESTAILLAARAGEDCHAAVSTPNCGRAPGYRHRGVPIDPVGLSEWTAAMRS